MKPKARFIKSIIDTAQSSETAMPWTRGARRASFVAARRANTSVTRRVKTA